MLDSEGRVGGIGCVMALDTNVVGTWELDWSHYGKDGLGTQFLVVRRMAARTGDRALLGWTFLEQVGEGRRAGTMKALANEQLDRFKIDASGLAAVGKDLLRETLYLAGGFLLDRLERFFPCSDSGSGCAGRT